MRNFNSFLHSDRWFKGNYFRNRKAVGVLTNLKRKGLTNSWRILQYLNNKKVHLGFVGANIQRGLHVFS